MFITNNNTEKNDIFKINTELSKRIFAGSLTNKSIENMSGSTEDDKAPTVKLMKDADEVLNQKVISNKQEIENLTISLNSEKQKNDAQELAIDQNTIITQQFENERADYVRVEDISGSATLVINKPITDEGADNYKIDLQGIDFSNFKVGPNADVKLTAGSNSVFVKDSFNDSSGTDQTISLDGKTKNVNVKITPTEIIISGNLGNSAASLLGLTASTITQLSSAAAGSAIDTTARQQAFAANTKAQQAEVKADNRVSKQLSQNVDFSTLADLKTIINDNELVALSFASGFNVTGRIEDTGQGQVGEAIIVSGSYTDGTNFKIGNFSIDSNLTVSGGIVPMSAESKSGKN